MKEQTKPEKMIKVYFCPKCKSKDVGFIFSWKNAFGIIPKMKCDKCGFESNMFPLLVVSEEKLKKSDKQKGGKNMAEEECCCCCGCEEEKCEDKKENKKKPAKTKKK